MNEAPCDHIYGHDVKLGFRSSINNSEDTTTKAKHNACECSLAIDPPRYWMVQCGTHDTWSNNGDWKAALVSHKVLR